MSLEGLYGGPSQKRPQIQYDAWYEPPFDITKENRAVVLETATNRMKELRQQFEDENLLFSWCRVSPIYPQFKFYVNTDGRAFLNSITVPAGTVASGDLCFKPA